MPDSLESAGMRATSASVSNRYAPGLPSLDRRCRGQTLVPWESLSSARCRSMARRGSGPASALCSPRWRCAPDSTSPRTRSPTRAGRTSAGYVAEADPGRRGASAPRAARGQHRHVQRRLPAGPPPRRAGRLALHALVDARDGCADGEPDGRAGFVEALDLWRGQPFADLEGWEPAAGRRSVWPSFGVVPRTTCFARLASGTTRRRRGRRGRVREEPLRERRWALLALAQYRGGRQGDALATIRRAGPCSSSSSASIPARSWSPSRPRSCARTRPGRRRAPSAVEPVVPVPGPRPLRHHRPRELLRPRPGDRRRARALESHLCWCSAVPLGVARAPCCAPGSSPSCAVAGTVSSVVGRRRAQVDPRGQRSPQAPGVVALDQAEELLTRGRRRPAALSCPGTSPVAAGSSWPCAPMRSPTSRWPRSSLLRSSAGSTSSVRCVVPRCDSDRRTRSARGAADRVRPRRPRPARRRGPAGRLAAPSHPHRDLTPRWSHAHRGGLPAVGAVRRGLPFGRAPVREPPRARPRAVSLADAAPRASPGGRLDPRAARAGHRRCPTTVTRLAC